VVPKIINRPETKTSDVAEPKRPETTVPKAEPPASQVAPPQTPPTEEAAERRSVSNSGGHDPSISVSLLSVVRGPTVSIVAAFGGLALVLLAVFALARRRERVAGGRPRDIASVTLEERRGRSQLVPSSDPPRPPYSAPPPRPQPPAQPAVQQAAWADRIPQTRAEAMQVLGMGVTLDANETAMKKIVDGLRLSWHPDLAKNEADRQLREFRVKQINAAWELIQGKRLERLDS
jgi:hypothetical protein